MKRRVYVRGVGAVSALGSTWKETAGALANGRSAVARVTRFDVTGFPCTVAAAWAGNHADAADPRLALLWPAVEEALREARINDGDSVRRGVFVGAESGRASLRSLLALTRAGGGGAAMDYARFAREAPPLMASLDVSAASPASVACAIAERVSAQGPVETVSLACASGAAAIAEGVRAIQMGECDVAICGGVGTDVDPLMMAGFGLLGALSAAGVSRPFDVRRDGFVVGEGAAAVVLTAEHGDVELCGTGRSMDAHHLTMPHPQGAGVEAAMRRALAEAELNGVDVVQAHGTSTPLNDAVEARAIARVFQGAPWVTSVKGALGHWVAGAGALGVLCAVYAVRTGVVFPTAGLTHPDPDLPLRHVMGSAVEQRVTTSLVNACAFGGANVSLVVRACG